MTAAALGLAAAVVIGLALRRGWLEWRLLNAGHDSLTPFAERLHALEDFLLTQVNEPVVFLAGDGTINGVSNSAERMLGQRSVLLVGRPLGSFFAEGCEAHAAIVKSLATGEEIRRQTVTMKLLNAPERKIDLVAKRYQTKERDEWWILFKG